jgi:hypothetical protein
MLIFLSLPTMFPTTPSKATPTNIVSSPTKSLIRDPSFHALPSLLPHSEERIPVPPDAASVPPAVPMLLKNIGLKSIYHTLRYFGLPKEAGMFSRGYAPFRNATIAFLATNRHLVHTPCEDPAWNCEFRHTLAEMDAFGKTKGDDQLFQYVDDVRGLTLDLVSKFLPLSYFSS